jgi:hypothetical protein
MDTIDIHMALCPNWKDKCKDELYDLPVINNKTRLNSLLKKDGMIYFLNSGKPFGLYGLYENDSVDSPIDNSIFMCDDDGQLTKDHSNFSFDSRQDNMINGNNYWNTYKYVKIGEIVDNNIYVYSSNSEEKISIFKMNSKFYKENIIDRKEKIKEINKERKKEEDEGRKNVAENKKFREENERSNFGRYFRRGSIDSTGGKHIKRKTHKHIKRKTHKRIKRKTHKRIKRKTYKHRH